MANISNFLTAIKNAVYGEEVRDAIHDSIEAINSDVSTCVENYNNFNEASETYISDRLDNAVSDSQIVQDALNNSSSTSLTELQVVLNNSVIDDSGNKAFSKNYFYLRAKNGIGHFHMQITVNASASFNGTAIVLGYLRSAISMSTGFCKKYIDDDELYQLVVSTSSGKWAVVTINGADGAININNWGSNPAPVSGDIIVCDFTILLKTTYYDPGAVPFGI